MTIRTTNALKNAEPANARFPSIVGSFCAFLLCFLGVALLLGKLLPFPPVPSVSEKLAYFQAHADQFDTVFFGSSRVARQIDPALFDQAMRVNGLEARSYNFGIDAMFSPEDLYVCEQVLAMKPARLRRVILEASGFFTNFADQDPNSIRATYWHDGQRVALLYREIFRQREKKFRWRNWKSISADQWARLQRFELHLEAFFRRFTSFGRGALFMGANLMPKEIQPLEKVLGPARNGYIPAALDAIPAGLERFQAELAERQQTPARRAKLSPAAESALASTLQSIRDTGAEVFLLISPTTGERRMLPSDSIDVPVLDFSDIQAWPALFASEHRLDPGHLNRTGSEIYSRLLGDRVKAVTSGAP